MKKFLVIIAVTFVLVGGYLISVLLGDKEVAAPSIVPTVPMVSEREAVDVPTARVSPPSQPAVTPETKTITHLIKLDVPFTVQAPFGNWSDPIFQNACEEASIVMAMGWLRGTKTISPESAQKQILEIVDFENKTFGYNTDTDMQDIQKIFQQFFHRQDVSAKENITLADIKSELQKGNLVIVPAFGRALGNPNFTQPGPIAHMLTIVGFDPTTLEFITNDPGTRRGAGYRYAEQVLFDAIWEYASGKDAPPAPSGLRKKAMIVVPK